MNKKDEKFMLSKYYRKDKGELQTNGLFSGKSSNKIIIQKKYMKEEVKIIQLRVNKRIDNLKIDYFLILLDQIADYYCYIKFILIRLNKGNNKFR
jgi:hypothetical protein